MSALKLTLLVLVTVVLSFVAYNDFYLAPSSPASDKVSHQKNMEKNVNEVKKKPEEVKRPDIVPLTESVKPETGDKPERMNETIVKVVELKKEESRNEDKKEAPKVETPASIPVPPVTASAAPVDNKGSDMKASTPISSYFQAVFHALYFIVKFTLFFPFRTLSFFISVYIFIERLVGLLLILAIIGLVVYLYSLTVTPQIYPVQVAFPHGTNITMNVSEYQLKTNAKIFMLFNKAELVNAYLKDAQAANPQVTKEEVDKLSFELLIKDTEGSVKPGIFNSLFSFMSNNTLTLAMTGST